MHTDHVQRHSDCTQVTGTQTSVVVGSTILLVAGSLYATQISDNPFVFLNVLAVFIFGIFTGASALAELKATNAHSTTVLVILSVATVAIAVGASWFVWLHLMAGV
ncbi:MAG: hypothetical protein AB8G18_19095 [Gammaproteobacteria bacterium]